MERELEENGLLKTLEQERESRRRLEEDNKKLQQMLILSESQVIQKTQELESFRNDAEGKIRALYQKLGKYKTTQLKYDQEIQTLQNSVSSLKSDYFKATDADISKSSKIDELYQAITGYRSEINALRSQVSTYQNEIIDLERDKHNLIRIIDVKKESKFVQTDFSYSINMATVSKIASQAGSPKRHSASLPLDCSLTKVRSQMLSLQKSKARLDMQIKLLSSVSEL